jgi:hypothetical protein
MLYKDPALCTFKLNIICTAAQCRNSDAARYCIAALIPNKYRCGHGRGVNQILRVARAHTEQHGEIISRKPW